ETNATNLVNALTGTGGAGLTINGVTFSGNTGFGGAVSSGTFTVGSLLTYNLRRGGIVLSSGDARDYGTGPNTSPGNTTSFGVPATPAQELLLQPITGISQHNDVTQLTINFDLQPGFDTLF